MPAGAGKDLVETRCILCHDLERVTAAKRQRQEWPGLVANMVGRGAPATPDEAQTITSYLAAHFGTIALRQNPSPSGGRRWRAKHDGESR